MPPLWSCKCPHRVYQATQACSSCFKTNGVKNNNLFRRYPDYVQIIGPGIDTCINSTESFRGPRVCSKLRKVLFRTIPNNRVSWFRNKFTNPNNSPPKRQNQKDKEEVSRSTRQSKHISSRIIKIPGAPNFFHSGNFSGPSPLSQPSVCQEPGVETVSVLRNYCTSQSSGSTRDSMVEGPSNSWNGRAILRQPI